MGGREREAEVAGGENDCGRRCFGRHALRRADLDQPLAERADDAPAADRGHDARDHRREQRGHDHLAHHAVDLAVPDPHHPRAGSQCGADQSAEQRVRTRTRQTQQPGQQIPDDAAEQPGHHDPLPISESAFCLHRRDYGELFVQTSSPFRVFRQFRRGLHGKFTGCAVGAAAPRSPAPNRSSRSPH